LLNSINPNVILLIIDSFRSDKFSDIDTSKKPNIDNLIKKWYFLLSRCFFYLIFTYIRRYWINFKGIGGDL